MEPYDIHKKTADPPGPPVHMPHFKRSDECAVGIALLPGRIHAVVLDRSGRAGPQRICLTPAIVEEQRCRG